MKFSEFRLSQTVFIYIQSNLSDLKFFHIQKCRTKIIFTKFHKYCKIITKLNYKTIILKIVLCNKIFKNRVAFRQVLLFLK